MGHKRKKHAPQLSSDSESQNSSHTSLSQSQSCSSSQDILEKNLSKKDLKKLYKLQKMIEKEQKLLKKEKQQKIQRSKIKKEEIQKQKIRREQHVHLKNFKSDILESKKLFITAIDNKYSRQQVDDQLNYILKSLEGVQGFRIKMKQGFATYAFVDFDTKQNARVGIQKLRSKKLFGQKIAIYYSQDQQRDNNKIKKCFQCNGTGHFAKQCLNAQGKVQMDNEQTNINRVNLQEMKKKQNAHEEKNQSQGQQKPKCQAKAARVVRDKNRLNRLIKP